MSTTPDKYPSQFYPSGNNGTEKSTSSSGGGGSESAPKGPASNPQQGNTVSLPVVQMPKGGGAIKGIGEKFQANPVTGTGGFTVPLPLSPGRNGFTPALALSYDSGAGNSPFGLGWNVGIPSISRKTDKGLPQYHDADESDVFLLAGAEDLVRCSDVEGVPVPPSEVSVGEGTFMVYEYLPRTEGLFAKIQRWENTSTRISHWRVVTRDNVTTLYGFSQDARIFNPANPVQVFQWMAELSTDNKGSLMHYVYKKENSQNIAPAIFEHNRLATDLSFSNLYIKEVLYGNTAMHYDLLSEYTGDWHFRLVFDYGEHQGTIPPYNESSTWNCRPDPFSSFRSGFEIRTWRLCQRIIMFHKFEVLDKSPVPVKVLTLDHELRTDLTLLLSVTLSGIGSGSGKNEGGGEVEPEGGFAEPNGEPESSTSPDSSDTFPPVSFTYSQAVVASHLNKADASDLPNYVPGQGYQWTDLYGEGLSGLLLQDYRAWYYKQNLGDKAIYSPPAGDGDGIWLTAPKPLASLPSVNQGVQVGDIDGNGRTDVQVMQPGMSGFYELNPDGKWEAFRYFKQMPNIDFGEFFIG